MKHLSITSRWWAGRNETSINHIEGADLILIIASRTITKGRGFFLKIMNFGRWNGLKHPPITSKEPITRKKIP